MNRISKRIIHLSMNMNLYIIPRNELENIVHLLRAMDIEDFKYRIFSLKSSTIKDQFRNRRGYIL